LGKAYTYLRIMPAKRKTASSEEKHAASPAPSSANLKTSVTSEGNYADSNEVYASVQKYYGKVLSTSKDLQTNACSIAKKPPLVIRQALAKVPQEIKEKFYGCGSPLPMGIEGLSLLDLGSGSGQDCYLSCALVGPKGYVTGVDMTDEQLEVANKHVGAYTAALGYPKPNMSFNKGYIEFLDKAGVAPESQDMVISNCVINLSPDKRKVLEGVYTVLKPGGELYFSDVYCDRRLPDHIRNHEVLLGECIAGALYTEDFKRICHQVGFADPRQLDIAPVTVSNPELQAILGNAKFYSITYRCFKLPSLETLCEDYGQVAYYKGTIPNNLHSYALDDHHVFETGKPMLVCGNTASMLSETRLKPHFEVVGNRDTHYGLFPCGPKPAAAAAAGPECGQSGGGCC